MRLKLAVIWGGSRNTTRPLTCNYLTVGLADVKFGELGVAASKHL